MDDKSSSSISSILSTLVTLVAFGLILVFGFYALIVAIVIIGLTLYWLIRGIIFLYQYFFHSKTLDAETFKDYYFDNLGKEKEIAFSLTQEQFTYYVAAIYHQLGYQNVRVIKSVIEDQLLVSADNGNQRTEVLCCYDTDDYQHHYDMNEVRSLFDRDIDHRTFITKDYLTDEEVETLNSYFINAIYGQEFTQTIKNAIENN